MFRLCPFVLGALAACGPSVPGGPDAGGIPTLPLADGQADEGAAPGEFRTAPLVGLRFLSSYLHDGRASTVEAAILGHQGAGSEATVAVGRFTALSPADRATLLAYVGSL